MTNNCNDVFFEISDVLNTLESNVSCPLTSDERELPKEDEDFIRRTAWSNNLHPEEINHFTSHPYEFAKPQDTLCTDQEDPYYKLNVSPLGEALECMEISFTERVIDKKEEVAPPVEQNEEPQFLDLDEKPIYVEQNQTNNYHSGNYYHFDDQFCDIAQENPQYEGKNRVNSVSEDQFLYLNYYESEDIKYSVSEVPIIRKERNMPYVLGRNNYQNSTNNSNGFNDSRSSSTISSDKESQKPVKRTRTTKAERSRMTEEQKKLKKQEDNRKNTARHTERKNEKKQRLETRKKELKFAEDQLKSTVKYKEDRLQETSNVIRTETECNNQIEEIMQFYEDNKSRILLIHENQVNKDDEYKQLKAALEEAEAEYKPYTDHANRSIEPVCTNTYGSRKSRAKAKKEMCELELDVATIQHEISKYEKLQTLVEQFQCNVVVLFGHMYSGLSDEDKKYWQRSIIVYQLGEFQEFIS